MENIQTAEELKLEEEAAKKGLVEADVRLNIINEFGFDETDDKERIDKLVAKELEQNRKLSSAIGQKIKHREKVEELEVRLGKPPEKPKEDDKKENLSSQDLYALMDAKVPQEDVEEVVKASKVLGLTVAESLKSNVVKTILETKKEERKTAEAANTGGSRPGTSKLTGEKILSEAQKGNLPESDEGIKQLIQEKYKKK